jgi:hypothetical protein
MNLIISSGPPCSCGSPYFDAIAHDVKNQPIVQTVKRCLFCTREDIKYHLKSDVDAYEAVIGNLLSEYGENILSRIHQELRKINGHPFVLDYNHSQWLGATVCLFLLYVNLKDQNYPKKSFQGVDKDNDV